MNIIGVIPARLKSERFPNKLLAKINGISILKRVIQNANKLNIDKLTLVTDSKELIDFVKAMKNVDVDVFYQEEEVSCGSERVKEVYNRYQDYNYYMTIPADEPFIDINQINKHIDSLMKSEINNDIFTFFSKFYTKERLRSNLSCKIVTDKEDNVLYFSRSIIPITKDGNLQNLELYKKHLGIFIFTNAILKENLWAISKLASIEGLEQNMFLDNGYNVKALEINHKYYGIDTEKQIRELEVIHDSDK